MSKANRKTPKGRGKSARRKDAPNAREHPLTSIRSNTSALRAAETYARAGIHVVPVPDGRKGPVYNGWPKLRLGLKELANHFNGTPSNIGILLGEASDGLIDIDLDCTEAVAVSDFFLPKTLTFGREGNHDSHRIFVVKPIPRSRQFEDIDGTMIVELRSTGLQTIAPPSRHPCGEIIRFSGRRPKRPERCKASVMALAVSRLAAAALLGRHWPKTGSRQKAAMALAGALLRAAWSDKESADFIKAIAVAARDEETKKRSQAVVDTARKLVENQPTTGVPTLAALLGEDVVNRALDWLGINEAKKVTGLSDPIKGTEAKRHSTIRLTSVADLLSEKVDAKPDVVKDMLARGGLSVLAAKPKTGKSTITRSLAVAISRGEAFLGRDTQQATVMLLALEDKRSEVKAHLRVMGARDEEIYVHTGPVVGEREIILRELEDLIRRHSFGLVIIDTLYHFIRVRDVNDYSQVIEGLEPLLSTARDTGAHILVCHHTRKGDHGGGDTVLGSTGLFGTVDTLLLLKAKDNQRIIHSQQRYGVDLPPTHVILDAETRRIVTRETIREQRASDVAETILAALKKPLTEKGLKDAVGGDRAMVADTLRMLCKDGRVKKSGKGKKGDAYRYVRKVS